MLLMKLHQSAVDLPMCQENGNVVRESDKREEIYFEKGQTKQLVEKWKTKQISPDRDQQDGTTAGEERPLKDQDILQTGKAKNLVQMFKTMDKENTPPPERRGPRPITPPPNDQRKLSSANDDQESNRHSHTDDTVKIESGHAKAAKERFMQNVEQNNTVTSKTNLKQITPPPDGVKQRKSSSPSDVHNTTVEQYETNEDIIPTKGQAKNLKNRFVEYEQEAKKVETASSKVKYTPKRFVDTPAPKQTNIEPAIADNKCFVCNKTVYAMEKVEADKKVYHKACFKCMHCKSVLKPGNFTSLGTKIYCKPHYMQLFAVKGNYSSGFGLEEHKSRWSQQPQNGTQLQNTNHNNSRRTSSSSNGTNENLIELIYGTYDPQFESQSTAPRFQYPDVSSFARLLHVQDRIGRLHYVNVLRQQHYNKQQKLNPQLNDILLKHLRYKTFSDDKPIELDLHQLKDVKSNDADYQQLK
ncbi:unnamed protein product [Didymodactylos carnosus]|uniref:LIM zinc-binding domain-containing protein n=1 Tax=Didymodactylos carnosus TaxID=1234261 RepID=A0A814Z3D7_9BILA|nr:unnamed protein product [Didymodactylos carnosus]CAF1237387.1 unnamed protein product [Didymodactylos carnosus]CAF3653737.1 unnamed protein product [Didymodactylos carnosus]CAF3999719.1 unnamed protein product [Didymodactylos carnosus]